MVVFAGASILLTIDHLVIGAVIAALVLVGVWVIVIRVPTRERVVAARAEGSPIRT
jgi:hypothetical protein